MYRKFYTTQLCTQKEHLKNRFTAIMRAKRTRRTASVLSALTAAIMLAATAFAGGIASDLYGASSNDVYTLSMNYGTYTTDSPVIRGGELFFPIRTVTRASDIDDSALSYDNGTVTLTVTGGHIIYDSPDDESPEKVEYKWQTSFTVGDTTAVIADKVITLGNAPVNIDGSVYVPYQYIHELVNYETMMSTRENGYFFTTRFQSVILQKYNAAKNEYTTDTVWTSYGTNENGVFSPLSAQCTFSGTGFGSKLYGTVHNIEVNENTHDDVSFKLNSVTRVFSGGCDLEGTFTVERNGSVILDNATGYINNLPTEKQTDNDYTLVNIRDGDTVFTARIPFYDWYDRNPDLTRYENNALLEDYTKYSLNTYAADLNCEFPDKAEPEQYLFIYPNGEAKMRIPLLFNSLDYYDRGINISLRYNSNVRLPDSDTLIGEFTVSNNSGIRTDSFEGEIRGLSGGEGSDATLRSFDGRYCIKMKLEQFIPLWWKEKDKSVKNVAPIR